MSQVQGKRGNERKIPWSFSELFSDPFWVISITWPDLIQPNLVFRNILIFFLNWLFFFLGWDLNPKPPCGKRVLYSCSTGDHMTSGWKIYNNICFPYKSFEKNSVNLTAQDWTNFYVKAFQHSSFTSVVKNFLHKQEFLAKSGKSCLSKIFLSFQDFLDFTRFSGFTSVVKNFLQRQELLAKSRNSCLSKIFLTFQDFLDFPRISWHQMWSYIVKKSQSNFLIFMIDSNF